MRLLGGERGGAEVRGLANLESFFWVEGDDPAAGGAAGWGSTVQAEVRVVSTGGALVGRSRWVTEGPGEAGVGEEDRTLVWTEGGSSGWGDGGLGG